MATRTSWDPSLFFDTTPYNGQPLPIKCNLVPAERVALLNDFPNARDDDLIVSSFPKAGTHWAVDIAYKILLEGDLEAAAKAGRPYLELAPKPGQDGNPEDVHTIEAISKMPSPRVFSTHLWYENLPPNMIRRNVKVIYIWRNWKDCTLSRFDIHDKKHGTFTSGWDSAFDAFISPDSPYGLWPDHIKSYQKQVDNPQVLIVNYEEMRKSLLPTVKRMASFLGKTNLSEDVLKLITDSCSFKEAKRGVGRQYVNKGIVGRWKDHFSPAQSAKVDALIKEAGLENETFIRTSHQEHF